MDAFSFEGVAVMDGYDDDAWMGGPGNPSRRANGKFSDYHGDVAATVAPAVAPAPAPVVARAPAVAPATTAEPSRATKTAPAVRPTSAPAVTPSSAATPAPAVVPADSPSPSPAPAKPAAVKEETPAEILSARDRAENFRKGSGAIYLGNISGAVMRGTDDPEMMVHYLHGLTADCNAHTNPMQRLLVEQIACAHHRIASMHCNAANAKTPESMVAYNAAAARLMAELRKSMLALQQLQNISMRGTTFRKISKAQVKEITPD